MFYPQLDAFKLRALSLFSLFWLTSDYATSASNYKSDAGFGGYLMACAKKVNRLEE
jgi:hypothetical protein